MREMQNRNLRKSDVHDLEQAINEVNEDMKSNKPSPKYAPMIDYFTIDEK